MKVSIIGATGNVGSCAAFNIAIQDLADEIVMIGSRQNVLKSHVVDIDSSLVEQ